MRTALAMGLLILLSAAAPPAPEAPVAATAEEKPGEGMLAISGADVWTGTGAFLRGGTVLVGADGRIAAVGARVTVPAGATVVDGAGKYLTPGLVAPLAEGIGLSGPAGGGNRFADAIDPYSFSAELARSAGITTIFARTGGGGSCAVLKLGGSKDLERRVLLDPAAVTIDHSGPAARRGVRETLAKARSYLAELRRHEAEAAAGKAGAPPRKPVGDEWLALLEGRIPARIQAGTTEEILAALALMDEFDVRLVLEGAHESWIVAAEIARRGAFVMLVPRNIPSADRLAGGPSGGTIECARILEEHGVRYSVLPAGGFMGRGSGISLGGIGGRDLLFLPMEAAYAVRGGASEGSALAAITSTAAAALQVRYRVGAIEKGLDADLVLWSGPPLKVASHAERVWIDGVLSYDRADSKVWK